MKYLINQETARELNLEGQRLVSSLSIEPSKAVDSPGRFHPNYLTTIASLRKNETPEHWVNPTIGTDGFEVARSFPDVDPPIGFYGQSHQSFIELCRRVFESIELEETVSETFIVESCFEWMRQRHLNKTDTPLTEYVFRRCERNVAIQEVWFPLVDIRVAFEIRIGRVSLKPVTHADWRRWVSEWQSRQPVAIPDLRRFLLGVESEGITVAMCRATAEPIRAVEIALKEVEAVLDVLRYYSPQIGIRPCLRTVQ